MPRKSSPRLYDRDLSWLAFNERVLLEAMSPDVALLDRLTFLGIVSSNLDEFFRVRVARLRDMMRLKKKQRARLGVEPRQLLQEILARAQQQQITIGRTLRGDVLPALANEGIRLVDERQVSERHHPTLRRYFVEQVLPLLTPIDLAPPWSEVFLGDRCLYLAVARCGGPIEHRHQYEPRWSLIEVPTMDLPRFVPLAAERPGETNEVIFLDDVIRMHLDLIFPGEMVDAAYAINLVRDAELHLDEELDGAMADKIRRSLIKRRTGVPSRFLFDGATPFALVDGLREGIALERHDLVPGWRYHHLTDLARFPDFGRTTLRGTGLPPLPHPHLDPSGSIFTQIANGDQLLELPYHAFAPVVRLLTSAAEDPNVTAIWISLYRIAKSSAVAEALIAASRRGVRVTAFVEIQARFDEATNLEWADRMRAEGVTILSNHDSLKVHAKIALVERQEGSGLRRYAYLGTGNFNERTATVYADLGLFTADPEITAEVSEVFAMLESAAYQPAFTHLLVAPYDLRGHLMTLIAGEIAEAEAGRPARMILKMNSLEDPTMIAALYAAAEAGVEIDLIVRGICCLIPESKSLGGRIRVRSLVDRFLEHARVFWFYQGGEEVVYVGSADWMQRNLDRRVEVVFPILDPGLAKRVTTMLRYQLADNQQARVIDGLQTNPLVAPGAPAVRAQLDYYRMLAR